MDLKITVITITYNSYEGLKKTLHSTINQTYGNIERIIIDGASDDGSMALLQEKKEFIDKLVSEPDTGIYDAMNKGLTFATGDYCLMLNAGDEFFSNTSLEEVVSKINDNSSCYFCQSQVTHGTQTYVKPTQREFTDEWLQSKLPIHQSVLIPKSVFNERYDLTYQICGDYDYLLRVFSRLPVKFIPVFLSKFYLGGTSNWYRDYSHFSQHIKEHLSLFKKYKWGRWYSPYYVRIAFVLKFLMSRVLNENAYFNIIRKINSVQQTF